MQLRLSLVIPIQLLLLLLPILVVHGFANYLLSRAQCFTELSTDEAIMNAMVIAASDSTDPTMRIEVLAPDEAEDSVTIVNDSNDPLHTVLIAKTLPVTLSWRVVSSAIPKNDDYQWVMDVVVPTEADTATTASFVQGSCDGKWRVAGRGPHEAAALAIQEGGNTTLLAAWASSYGPVTLTQPMVVTVRSSVPSGLGGREAPKPPPRVVSKSETPGPGKVEWTLVLLLLLLAMLLLGGFWWYRIRPRYMKGQRWHL
jgi:hypothetical protein